MQIDYADNKRFKIDVFDARIVTLLHKELKHIFIGKFRRPELDLLEINVFWDNSNLHFISWIDYVRSSHHGSSEYTSGFRPFMISAGFSPACVLGQNFSWRLFPWMWDIFPKTKFRMSLFAKGCFPQNIIPCQSQINSYIYVIQKLFLQRLHLGQRIRKCVNKKRGEIERCICAVIRQFNDFVSINDILTHLKTIINLRSVISRNC